MGGYTYPPPPPRSMGPDAWREDLRRIEADVDRHFWMNIAVFSIAALSALAIGVLLLFKAT